jgi:hypothetical protein
MAAGAGRAAKAYELLEGDGHKPVRARLLAAAFPLGIRGLSLVTGPLSADLSGPSLRRNGIVSMGEALRRLGVGASHVVYGHTHRAGPLPADDAGEWLAPTGARLVNCGNWVYETQFMAGPGGASPYWPGGMVEVGDAGDPVVHRLLGELAAEELRPAS